MKILLIVDAYLPSTKSGAKLIHDLAGEFVALGHEAAVVAPDESCTRQPTVAIEDGIEVVRVQAGAIKKASLWRRGLNEALLSSRIWKRCSAYFRSKSFDLIVYYSPSIFFGDLVANLKSLYRCPSYLILRDIFPQWALDAGVLRKGPAYFYFKFKEHRQYRVADVIGVQSPANMKYFQERGWDKKFNLQVLYNWTRLQPQTERCRSVVSRFVDEGRVVLFYGGNIGVAQDCDNLLRLAAGLKSLSPEAYLLMVGQGSEVARLRNEIGRLKLDNVSIHDSIPQTEYATLVSQVDIGLVSLDRNLKTQNFPGKILSYMQAGIPLLSSINPGNDLREVIEAAGAGFVCENGDDASFHKRAVELVRDPSLRKSMGNAARRLLEERFAVASAAKQILQSRKGPGS